MGTIQLYWIGLYCIVSGGVYSSGISGVSAVNQANVTSSTGCFIWTHEPARTHLPIPPFAKRVRSITTPLYTCSILGMGAALNCLCSKKEPKKKEITDLGGTISRDPEESEEDDHTLFRRAAAAGRRASETMGQIAGRPKLSRDQIRSLQRHVSFSEDEIKDWYREFCQSTSRGQDDLFLTEQEFCKVYNSVYPGQSSEFAKHIFRTFDLTGDNRVSFKEFLIGLSFSGSDNPEKQLKWAFRVYDVHKTGYITQEDMTQIIQSVFKMIGPRTLRDNDVSDTPEAMADELFHQLDKDGDQRISWEEFCECAPSNPNVLQLLQCGPPESDEPAARD